ncbi:MAG: hypothetical protein K9K37_11505 [Desulfocapsa sp.]|nr:hypothetical protein [Desulfocapsa sp.]
MMSTSLQIVFEFFFGSILLYWSIRSQLTWLSKIFEKYFDKEVNKAFYAKMVIRLILGLVGVHLLLDPLIPGQPTVHVHAPTEYPTVVENLRVRIVPIKFDGNIDPARISSNIFAGDLAITKVVVFHVMEQRLHLRLYDVTQPENFLGRRVVYLSPYIRLGLWDKHVHF